MGRGRAKAKQTKVARELKYRHLDTDFTQLQRELHGDDASASDISSRDLEPNEETDDDSDDWARYA